jgi:DNA replication protein DnaC
VTNELLTRVVEQAQVEESTGYKSRWATCRAHDQEYIEVRVPSLEIWVAAEGCRSCARERETGHRQPRRGQTMQELRLELAGIPERFRNKTLADFAPKAFKDALAIARTFAAGDNLLCVGPLASGKTSYACALLRELLVQAWAEELSARMAGNYVTTAGLMERLWQDSNPRQWVDGGYHDDLTETLKEFGHIGILVVDDVTELRTAEELAWLQRILGIRRANKRSTIVLGGPDLESLELVLGSRLLNDLRAWKLLSFGKESV